MTTYYEIKAINIDGDDEILYGSFVKSEAQYELQAERDSWKADGYKCIAITSRDTDDQPDPEVYSATELGHADADLRDLDDCEICGAMDELSHNDETGLALCLKCDNENQPTDDDDGPVGMKHFDSIPELTAYLTETLIPDLKEAGSSATAEDFEDCLAAIAFLQEVRS